MPDDAKNLSAESGKHLPIKHIIPDGLQTSFVNHVVIQHNPDGDFYLSFFQVNPPMIIGNDEDRQRQFEKLDSVEARCVSRIVMSKDKCSSFIVALAQNYSECSQSSEKADQQEDKHAG